MKIKSQTSILHNKAKELVFLKFFLTVGQEKWVGGLRALLLIMYWLLSNLENKSVSNIKNTHDLLGFISLITEKCFFKSIEFQTKKYINLTNSSLN